MTASTERQRRTEALDRLAEDILRGLEPLEFRPAATAQEVDATLRLRYLAVVETGWATSEAFPDGRERDEFDDEALHLVCLDGSDVVGTLRLVPPAAGRPLPTERHFELRIDPPESAVDAGRVVVAPSHRGGRSHLVMAGLCARGWLEARRLGADRVIGVGSRRAINLYEALGMLVTQLGPPRRYWGEERSPIELVGAEDAPEIVRAANPPARQDIGPEPEQATAPAPSDAVTRRGLLAGAGSMAAALLVVGIPPAAEAATLSGVGPRAVGAGPTDRRTIDFIARIDQVARDLLGSGYLTRVAGLPGRLLLTRAPSTSTTDPGAADPSTRRLTLVLRARIDAISMLGSAITGHGRGTAEVHLLPAGGANLADPNSFGAGTIVAGFGLTFQHSLAIDSPDHALASFTADLTQRSARVFTLAGQRYQLGRPGIPWSLRASGRGERTEPTTPRSLHFVSGDLGVIDALTRR